MKNLKKQTENYIEKKTKSNLQIKVTLALKSSIFFVNDFKERVKHIKEQKQGSEEDQVNSAANVYSCLLRFWEVLQFRQLPKNLPSRQERFCRFKTSGREKLKWQLYQQCLTKKHESGLEVFRIPQKQLYKVSETR